MVNTSNSTSTSQPKPSVAGWAVLSGLAILANPRVISASKTIVLDAQVFLGPTDLDLLIGSLRYFNSTDHTFKDEPHFYAITTTFARRESVADVPVSGNRELVDYTFIGDILTLIALGAPGPHYLDPEELPNDGNEGYVHLNDLRTFTIDPCVRPYIQVTGVAMEVSKAEATFELAVEQYISCAKSDRSTKQADGNRTIPTTRFFCHIPDSPKYKSCGKPMPGNKRWVSVGGFLTKVERSRDNSEVEKFRIDVGNLTFCGQYISPANSSTFVSQNSPGKSAALFSYGAPPQSSQPRKLRNQDGV